MTHLEHIKIFDTTLRDGEQSPGCSMNLSEKVRLARRLQALGVDIIEAGFPIASDGDFEAVRAVAAEGREVAVAALCRTTEQDALRAWEAVGAAARARVHPFGATSDIHLEHKLKKSRAEVLRMTREAVRLASSLTEDVEFSAEDATRSDLDYLCEIFAAAAEEGARTLNVPDTVGYTTPTGVREIARPVRERVVGERDVVVSVHCHNDLGLAVANSLAALDAGARQVECTINGIGERAGNAAREEVVRGVRARPDPLPSSGGVQAEELSPTSQLLAEIIGFGVQPNKAVVGRNAFAHEAGIHQHGVLSNPLCYEIMTPESVGVPSNNIVLGKHSGRHALSRRFDELGFTLTASELEDAYHQFTKLADRKKNIYDQDLLSLLPARQRHEQTPEIGAAALKLDLVEAVGR